MVSAALQCCIDEQQPSGATRTQRSRVPWHHHPIEDDLTLTTVLGTGHFAATYAATHNKNGKIFAVKSLDKSHPEYSFKDVCNEVEILAAVCDHPNIASLYEVYEDAENIYLVQEACLVGELFDLVIERKHFTEGDAARACQALISIISHCHARGVLHRDIKPENFLIKSILGSEEGRFDGSDVRAVDFGLSLFTKDRLDIPDIVGTSYYIAPEILAGEPYSPAADVWSLGIVVFILISGYPPFWGSSDNVIFDRIQNQELDIAYEPWTTDDVSLEAADFVKRLLHKDPTKRMTLAEAAQHPWLVNAAKNAAGADDANNKNTNTCLSAPLAPVIIDRLRAFTRENRLTCLLMTLVAHHLSNSAIGQLRKTFFSLDTDDDGLIGVADITKALQTNVQQTSATKNTTVISNGTSFAEKLQQEQGIAELVAQLNEAVNVGKNTENSTAHPVGQVNVDEFLAAALDRKKVLTNRTVSAVFHRLDEKNEGKLNISVLSTALAECGIPVPEEKLRSMLAKEGALDGAGVVSPKSFQNLFLADAEEQNRPAVEALERILSGDLDDLLGTKADVPDKYLGSDIDNASDGISQLKKQTQNLKLVTKNTTPRSLEMAANKRVSTGARLDEVLKQYGASSGYRTPRRNRRGGGGGLVSVSTSFSSK